MKNNILSLLITIIFSAGLFMTVLSVEKQLTTIPLEELKTERFQPKEEVVSTNQDKVVQIVSKNDTINSSAQLSMDAFNQLDESGLVAINGIGPVLAKRIVEYRDSNGPFNKIDDLGNVKGIGPKILEKIKSQITHNSP